MTDTLQLPLAIGGVARVRLAAVTLRSNRLGDLVKVADFYLEIP